MKLGTRRNHETTSGQISPINSPESEEMRQRWENVQSQSRRTESRVNRRKTRTRTGYGTKENSREFCELFDFVWVFFFSIFVWVLGFLYSVWIFVFSVFFWVLGFASFFWVFPYFLCFFGFFRLPPRTVTGFGDIS